MIQVDVGRGETRMSEPASLIRCDGLQPQRRALAFLRRNLDRAALDADRDARRHPLRAATCLELVYCDGSLDLEVAAQSSEQRSRDADRAALVALGQRGRQQEGNLLVTAGAGTDRLLDLNG